MVKSIAAVSVLIAATSLAAETYVVPVVTARIRPTTYSTTTGFRNDSSEDVRCSGRYVRADGSVLTTAYTIKAGTHLVEPDTLLQVAAVGIMRIDCSGEIVIASRIQSSSDDGATFDAGYVFAAAKERDAVTSQKPRTMKVDGDVLAMEADGISAVFSLLVKDGRGAVVGKRRYELAPYAQQHISMASMVSELGTTTVEIQVASGRVVVAEQSRSTALSRLAPEVTFAQRVRAASLATAPVGDVTPSITELLLTCPFKAAPFRDPATGRCFMRDRWYDLSTGTFLTSDPEGYADSSNLYAYCKHDPVNCGDPTGRSATVVGGLLGTIGGSGYTIYRSVRYGDPFTWRYIGQGAISGAAIGFGIDTLGTGAGLSASVLGGAAIGAGGGGAFSSIESGGDWTAYGTGALKGGVLGGIAGATGYGISTAGLTGGWSFAGSVTADTYAGVGMDYLFGDATTLSGTFTRNAIGSVAGNTLGYGAAGLSASWRPLTSRIDPGGLPTITAEELDLIAGNLRRQGVEVTIGGLSAEVEMASAHARGLFFPTRGRPGRFVVGENAPRVVVYEELLHFAQHRRASFTPTSRTPYADALIEIEAYRHLQTLADRLGWTETEKNFLASQRYWWEEQLWELRR